MTTAEARPQPPAETAGRLVVVDEAATARIVTMRDAVDVAETVLRDLGQGAARLSDPPATFLEGDAAAGTHFKVKGGIVPAMDACGFRIVGDVGRDGAGGEHHYCYLLDPRTAAPVALVAQTHIHRMRTAATGLLAARLLSAAPTPTVALLGAGRIGACLAAGFHEIFPDGRLVIASRRFESAERMAASVGRPSVAAARTVAEAVEAADVVVALSSSDDPLFGADLFRPGMTVIGMGENHELPVELLRAADRFYVDDLAYATVLGSIAAWVRRGHIDRGELEARLTATVGDLVVDPARGRASPDERIFCVVQGLAIADLALAELCRRRALETGAGRDVPL